MPTITTAEVLCGPRPAPHRSAFLRWVDEYISRRTRQCQVRRANVFYIDPTAADNSQGTFSLPWNNLGRIRTWLTNNAGGDASFLFRRGTIIRDYVGIVVNRPNIHFGVYGPLTESANPDKPIISHFCLQWTPGARFTLAAGNRYTTTNALITSVPAGLTVTGYGFVRVADDPFNPLIAVASSAECESTDFSFFSSGTTLHINLAGINPNGLTVEAVPLLNSPPDGIQVANGSTGLWIDGLRGDGWGCASRGITYSGTEGNESFIRNMAGGTASEGDHVALFTGCESYYHGAHGISQEPGGIGGAHLAIGCMAGFGWNGVKGEGLFNSYAGDAQHETVFKDCVARFGPLPQTVRNSGGAVTVAAGSVVTNQGKAFYAHQGGSTNSVGLYLNIGCRILDERSTYERATTYAERWDFSESADSMFAGTTNANPASIRAFIIDWKSPRTRTGATAQTIQGMSRVIYINSHFYIRKTWGAGSDLGALSQNWNALFINPIFEMDLEQGTNANLVQTTSTPTAGMRLINPLLIIRGHAGAGTNRWHVSFANSRDRIRLANALIISERWRDTNQAIEAWLAVDNFSTSPLNNTDTLRYVAVAGAAAANSSNWYGFNGATGFLDLTTPNNTYPDIESMVNSGSSFGSFASSSGYSLDPASPLVGAGAAVPFADKADMLPAPEYDFFGRRRPTTPSIGPFDVLNISTGSAPGLSAGSGLIA